MMRGVELVLGIGWAAFWLYWLVAAFFYEKGPRAVVPRAGYQGGDRGRRDPLAPLGCLSGARLQHGPVARWPRARPVLSRVGVRDLGAGAHRARLGHLDDQKDKPELVTSGPCHLVRHPIYSGILVAGAGTAAALSWLWLTAVALAGVYSATVEEHYLTGQFPDAYPAYERSTKMLVPFIF
jgi:hypothetical protein